jgi:hypothetical protein
VSGRPTVGILEQVWQCYLFQGFLEVFVADCVRERYEANEMTRAELVSYNLPSKNFVQYVDIRPDVTYFGRFLGIRDGKWEGRCSVLEEGAAWLEETTDK